MLNYVWYQIITLDSKFNFIYVIQIVFAVKQQYGGAPVGNELHKWQFLSDIPTLRLNNIHHIITSRPRNRAFGAHK